MLDPITYWDSRHRPTIDVAAGDILGMCTQKISDVAAEHNRALWAHHRGTTFGADTVERLHRDHHYKMQMRALVRSYMTIAERRAHDARLSRRDRLRNMAANKRWREKKKRNPFHNSCLCGRTKRKGDLLCGICKPGRKNGRYQ